MKEFEVNRRDFMRLSGLATAGVLATACGAPAAAPSGDAAAPAAPSAGEAATPVPAAPSGLKEVPREKTMIFMFLGSNGQFANTGVANVYAVGSDRHRNVTGAPEPLFYYSAFADETIPWLATGAEYNADFTELVVHIREGVEWSDGEPFTANDVAFTLNMLINNAPLLTNSAEVKKWVKEATAVDDLTVKIVFNLPRPRFLWSHLNAKYDTGILWVPEHIYKDVAEPNAFAFFDLEKGWPVVTGPFNIISWTPEQQIIDRRDDWWAAKIGFAELPEIERIISLPLTGEERMAQLIINNDIDSSLDLRANTIIEVVNSNPAVITHTNRELPLGYIDWWPTSIWFNCSVAPFDTKETRWAISYAVDREQMLQVALSGSGILTQLPFPYYPPLMPYIEAAAPLLEKYNTNEFSLEKSAAMMEGQGYAKDGDGFWAKDGQRITEYLYGTGSTIFDDIGPVIAEQLRKGGFEIEYNNPADSGTKRADGTEKLMLFGHGGSIIDPFDTLDMYTSKYFVENGQPAIYQSRYQNPEYDAVLDEMAAMAPSSDDPAYMDLYLKAIEIYLAELIDAPVQQWLHRMPMNTTYWTGWPTVDNPYCNGAFWHQTVNLVFLKLKAAKA